MLTSVLHEIEKSKGAIRMQTLSQKLGIDESVLEGMIEHWVRKGRIRRMGQDDLLCGASDCKDNCPFCSKG